MHIKKIFDMYKIAFSFELFPPKSESASRQLFAKLKDLAEMSAGTRFPARRIKSFMRAARADHQQKVGIHWTTEQVRDLIDNKVKSIHLYTLNKPNATRQIYDSLMVTRTRKIFDSQL